MIKGNVIIAKCSGNRVSISSKFGTIGVTTEKTKKADFEKRTKKIVTEVVPKSEFIGSTTSGKTETFIFSAPKGWKGGVNA